MSTQDRNRFPIDVNPYARRTYPHAEENWAALVDNWQTFRDRLILFLGAGASIGAASSFGPLPDAYKLRNLIYSKYVAPEIDPNKFDFGNLNMSLDHAATLASTRVGEDIVKNYVAQHFLADAPPWQHSILGFLQPRAIFTTNYDNLIDLGWRHAQMAMSNSIGNIQEIFRPNHSLLHNVVPVYKPHGSAQTPTAPISEGGIVLTQADYFKMQTQQPMMLREFMSTFRQSCVIFVGYSFNDLNIAANLYDIHNSSPGKVPWFAVFPRYELSVRQRLNREFGIIHIARSFLDFLIELDERVNFIPSGWKFSELPHLIQTYGLLASNPAKTTVATS
jgi:hypothetical protein